MINWWLMVMSRIMVMSNIMNFQDFDILSDGMFEIRGLYWRKMWFPSFLSNQFFTNCHMEQKKSGGCFSWFFPLIIPSPIGPQKRIPYGFSMDDVWKMHGLSMDNPLVIHRLSIKTWHRISHQMACHGSWEAFDKTDLDSRQNGW